MHLTKRSVEALEIIGKRYEIREDGQTGFIKRAV